jgi:dTMP kinase
MSQPPNIKGFFITFEGSEGCGKSTQLELAATALEKSGYEVLVTREPGGSKIGEAIRELLLNPQGEEITPLTEFLLFSAARAEHVQKVILPAIKIGKIVLCDRFYDSSIAYQGGGRGLSFEFIAVVNHLVAKETPHNHTLLFDLDSAQGMQRVNQRLQGQEADRIEKQALSFHQKVRQAYLYLAKAEPQRYRLFDAAEPIEKLHLQVMLELSKLLESR